jgi:D-tyrosyl-tRNA(Tyr) deacylase
LQRVSAASVVVAGECVGEIGPGVLVFLGLDAGDNQARVVRMIDKVLSYRMFSDAGGRMNHSVAQSGGGVLLVSQFTLSADTRKGLRPGFSAALAPQAAECLYHHALDRLRALHDPVAAGVFGADMQVSLTNDGPVTFLLQLP